MNFITLSKRSRIIELIILFVIVPFLLITSLPIWFGVFFVVVSFIYVLFLLYRYTKFKITKPHKSILSHFWKVTLMRLIPITIFGLIFVKIMAPDAFFRLITEDISVWFFIILIYSLGSVLPQEVIYRNFFFKRYRDLIHNKHIFFIMNAALFSMSHVFLKSWLVLLVTFLGGLMFAYTYNKTKSTTLVSIEHSIYGLMLFTIGIGALLAFPS